MNEVADRYRRLADRFTSVVQHVPPTAGRRNRRAPNGRIARIRSDADELGDAMRAPNVIGAPVTPPADADDQEQLLAFLARDPRLA